MGDNYWLHRWREERESKRYIISIAVTEGFIITGLVAALVWVLR